MFDRLLVERSILNTAAAKSIWGVDSGVCYRKEQVKTTNTYTFAADLT